MQFYRLLLCFVWAPVIAGCGASVGTGGAYYPNDVYTNGDASLKDGAPGDAVLADGSADGKADGFPGDAAQSDTAKTDTSKSDTVIKDASPEDIATIKGNVGDPCSVDAECTDMAGLTCFTHIDPVPAVGFPGMTWPGGYCSKECSDEDQNCGEVGSCSQSGSGGGRTSYKMQYCVKSCQKDTECRVDDGYKCQIVIMGYGYCVPIPD